jgi:long-chain acyl-CoA synthetase
MFNLAVLLEESHKSHPQKVALVCGDQRMTYAEVSKASNKVANGLIAAGVAPGDRVALSCPNINLFPITYFGIIKAGAIVVPLNILLRPPEIVYHLKDSKAKAYICFEGSAELPIGKHGWKAFSDTQSCENFWLIPSGAELLSAEQPALVSNLMNCPADLPDIITQADDPVVVLYTSGTTGKPKGAVLTHNNLFLNVVQFARLSHAENSDSQLITLPLFHSFGQSVQLCGGFYNGNKLVLMPRFAPQLVVDTLVAEQISIFCGVPTMYWALFNSSNISDQNLAAIRSNLRLCVSGGSPLPLTLLKNFEDKFQVPVLEGYGLSETSPVVAFNSLDIPRKPGSVGVPIWGIDIKIVNQQGEEMPQGEKGEIIIRGHNVMKCYLDRPEETREAIKNGWLYTGDIGYLDEDGYLFIADRVKDMIIRGGYNVYPRELEETLLTHPAISMAAVVGIPSPEHGEEVKAFVILKDGQHITSTELIAWCKEIMATYKYPRQIEIRKSMPMTATGKILKRELKTD